MTTLKAHVFCCLTALRVAANRPKNQKEDSRQRKNCISVCSFCLLLILSLSFIYTNSFQWLSNWKMEMLLLPSISAAVSWQQSNFLSSGINGIEQYVLIKRKKKKAHDCWPSCLSSTNEILSFKTGHCAVRPNNVAY